LQGQLLGEGDHPSLGHLVGHERVGVLPRRNRRDIDDRARALPAHYRDRMLAGHDRAPQIDRGDPVVGFLAQFVEWLVAAADRNADVVVEDVESALRRTASCIAVASVASRVTSA